MGVRLPLSLSNEPNFYTANKPTNQLVSLSPLFSSTNSKDIESIQRRIPGGGYRTPCFSASATNVPTITIGGTSRTIGSLFMNAANYDEIRIRVTPTNLVYAANDGVDWIGSGVLNSVCWW